MTYLNQRYLTTLFLTFLAIAFFGLNSCQKEGCTDENAVNYDPEATKDDGSCIYPPGGGTGGAAGDSITEDITSATTISSNTVICAAITVNADLTIKPGVTITFCNGAGIWVESGGSLNAEGTSDNPIVFTGATKTKGWWNEINFKANNPDNKLNHVKIEYGGGNDDWGDENSSLVLKSDNNAQLSIKNTTIQHSKGYGMWIEGGASVTAFSSNTFKNNGSAGLRVGSANLIRHLDASSTYANNNGESWIHIDGGDVSTEQTWANLPAPLHMGGHSLNAGVTMKPGLNIIFRSNGGLWIKNGAYLKAEGTSSDSIKFNGETKTPGFWDEINYNSNNPKNSLKYVSIKNGGSKDSWDDRSNVTLSNSDGNEQLSLNNCYIAESYGWGVYVESGVTLYVNDSKATTESEVKANNKFSGNGDEYSSCTAPCDVKFN